MTAVAVAYIAISEACPRLKDEFFFKLLTGEDIKAGDPILKAREHLMDLKYKKATTQTRMEAIFRYWNLWRRGIKVQRACALYGEWPTLEN